MDFWAFLNWIWQQIDKVLLWFGGAFWTLYIGAANAWNWAKSEALAAYYRAVDYISGIINKVYSFINWVKDYANGFATGLYHDAINFANWVYNQASAAIQSAKNYVLAEATRLYYAAVKIINEAIASVRAWVNDFIKASVKVVQDLFSPLLALKPVMNWLLQLTDPKVQPQLITLAQKFYGQIVTFFDDPLGFILGVMWGQFTTFLCFVLGYGLGSVEAQLPPIPIWGKRFSGGPVNPGPVSPVPGGQLVRPVSPMYISGYVFGVGHYGVDFGIIDGQDILASHSGVVNYAGWDSNGYGNRVDIEGSPYWTRYGHNKDVLVSVGQAVKAGQVIAAGNSTGNSTGSHLHFELKLNGSYVDPVLYL
jgi:murein DD-endopeptidase MepM/ murein hydrolase activator NlpD